jgi:hypothetical protein
MDIARQGEKIIRLINNYAFEAALEKMPVSGMTAIIIHCICCEKPPYQLGEGGVRTAFQKDVKMVGHQAINMNTEIKQMNIFCQIMKELQIILVPTKGILSGNGAGHHMIESIGKIYSFRSSHAKIYLIKGYPVSSINCLY